MRVKAKTLEAIRSLTIAFQGQNDAEIIRIVEEIGLDEIMEPDMMHLARGARQPAVVILLTTLAMANGVRPERAFLIFHAYQSILSGKLQADIAPLGASHIVIQAINAIITKQTEIYPEEVSVETDIANWLDAVELAIDFEQFALAENIIRGLLMTKPDIAVIISLKYRLTERHALLRDTIDWASLARCYHLVMDAIPDGVDDELKDNLNLHAVISFAKNEDWKGILEHAPKSTHGAENFVAFHRLAEAHCHLGDYNSAVYNLDELLEAYCIAGGEAKIESTEIASETADLTELVSEEKKVEFDPTKAGKALAELQEILSGLGKHLFLISGTLLGYARTGSVLSHDKDIDVGLFGWEDQFDIVAAILKTGKFKIFFEYLRGERMYQLPVCHLETGMTIDMFFYRNEGNKVITGVNAPWEYLQRFEFTPFMLRDAEFLGSKISVPHDIDLNLTENFGNWHVSIPDYVSHVESPSTMDQGGLVHQMVGRLNMVDSIVQYKYGRVLRILDVMKKFMDREGGMDQGLYDLIRSFCEQKAKENIRKIAS
jgi:hypothetical protein